MGKKEQEIPQQEEFCRQREETEQKQGEEERKRKEKEALEIKLREDKERKRREEEEKARREREGQEKLRTQREEAEKKSMEEIERRRGEEAAKAPASRQTVQSPVWQKVPPKKTPPWPPTAKPKSSSGKGILVFSLIFGILLIGSEVAFFGLNGDSGDSTPEIPPVSAIASSENAAEGVPEEISKTNSTQTSFSQNSDTYTNSIDMEFVKIPAGEFMMGSPSEEEGRYDYEGPVHKVTVKEAFYLGKFEVTQEQWREVMGSNPSNFKGDDLPVEKVSWNDVQEFIEKLNEMEGTNKYRLPSEAEWEYACRAGTTTRYYFGDDESKLGDHAWYSSNSDSKTYPVGQKKSNPWGLYDMYGNVCEWCQDRWHNDYDGAPSDGSAWEPGSSSGRVARGGYWFYHAKCCRSAYRDLFSPDFRYEGIGFRVMRIL